MTRLPRVLLVDDTPDLLKAHALALQMKPAVARVESAEGGVEALECYASARIAHDPFDLLVVDLAMPQMNGFVVAESIRKSGDHKTKILFFTSYDTDLENEPRARACGACGVWSKGRPMPDFRREVHTLLLEEKPKYKETKADAVPVTSDVVPESTRMVAQKAVRRDKTFVLVGWVIAAALVGNFGLTLFNMARAPRVYTAISNIDRKLDGAVTTARLPPGYRVTVPLTKSAFKQLKGKDGAPGRVRVTFEFEEKDSAAAASLASERGVPLCLNVTRYK